MLQIATLKSQFKASGYLHLKDYWPDLDPFEEAITALFRMQVEKIADYDLGAAPTLDKIVTALEASDKEALYQVQKFLPKSQGIRALFDDEFERLCADLLDCDLSHILIDGPALFVKLPDAERLLYKWHSEALYYPKRRNFLNIWFPVFNERRTEEDGAMAIMPGSHKRVWDASMMSEYTGFNKDTENKANHFVQYEIPVNFLTQYSRHVCEAERQDLIIFDRNLVHTSLPNMTDKPSYAIVVRVWDPSKDLTLSGNMECTPYGGNIGRSNLIVKP